MVFIPVGVNHYFVRVEDLTHNLNIRPPKKKKKFVFELDFSTQKVFYQILKKRR